MSSSRKTFLVVLTGILLAGSLVTATTIITGDHPDGYALEPELLPSENINATNATLRSNLEEMDEVYDAAVVYWNLTDTTTGETIRGPAATGFERGETVEADYVGLEPDAEYTLQAYAEPVVWDDETLIYNFVEKGLSNVPEGSESANEALSDSETAMNTVADSSTVMDTVADSSTAMDAVSISSHLDTTVFTDNYASEQVWGYYVENSEFTDYYSFSGFAESFHDAELSLVDNGYGGKSLKHEVNDQYSTPSGSPLLIGVVKTVDLSGKSDLWVDYDANGRRDYSHVYVEVDGDTKLNTDSGSGPDTFSVSEYDGEVEFIFAVRYERSHHGDEIELKAFRFE